MPIEKYYKTFDPKKKYRNILYRAMYTLQGRELNDQQAQQSHDLATLIKTMYTEGSIIEGGHATLTGNKVHITSGLVFASGYLHEVETDVFDTNLVGAYTFGVYLKETTVSELEDPSLRDPAVEADHYNQPGAWRLKLEAYWGIQGESIDSSLKFFPQYEVKGGALKQLNIQVDNNNRLTQALAKYDKQANGSFVVDGLQVTYTRDDTATTGNYIVSVSQGNAHVDGYEVINPYAKELQIQVPTDVKRVNNEPIYFVGDAEYPLRWGPIAEIFEVTGHVEVTVNVNHGNFSGAIDLLPHTPAVRILEVSQDSTVYTEGTDWVMQGDYISWEPSGDEPNPASTYKVKYIYQKTLSVEINEDRTSILLEGFSLQSTVSIDYTFYIPRVDRLLIERDGNFTLLKGTPHYLSPVAPDSATGLQLATIELAWGKIPIITMDYYRAFKMSDIQQMHESIGRVEFNIAQLSLIENIASDDPSTNKLNQLTDPFFDDDQRDMGLPQTCLVNAEVLYPGMASHDVIVNAGTELILAPYQQVLMIEQNAHSGVEQVNRFDFAEAPPGQLSIAPSFYEWIADTKVTTNTKQRSRLLSSIIWVWSWRRRARTVRTTSSSASSTKTRQRIESTSSKYSVPSIEINLEGGTFNGNEQVKFYIGAVLVQILIADESGLINQAVTLPTGIVSGIQLFKLVGIDSEVECTASFTSTPQVLHTLNDVTVTTTRRRRITRTRLRPRPRDPIAETFTLDTTRFITSLDLAFGTRGSSTIEIFITSTQLGMPNMDDVLVSLDVAPEDVQESGYTRINIEPLLLVANEEYAFIVKAYNPDTTIKVAELGKWDLDNSRWITRQSYGIGTLLISGNANAWTPVHNKDIMFKLNVAEFEHNVVHEVSMGSVSLKNTTDIMIAPNTRVLPGTSVDFVGKLSSGVEVELTPNVPTQLATRLTDTIEICSRLRTLDKNITPVISGQATLSVGEIIFPSEYVSRMFTPSTEANLKAVLNINEPAKTLFTVCQNSGAVANFESGTDKWAVQEEFGVLKYLPSNQGYKSIFKEESVLPTVMRYAGLSEIVTRGVFFGRKLYEDAESALYIKSEVNKVNTVDWTKSASGTNTYQCVITGDVSHVRISGNLLPRSAQGYPNLAAGTWEVQEVSGVKYLFVDTQSFENPITQINGYLEYAVHADGLNLKGEAWVKLVRQAHPTPVGDGFYRTFFHGTSELRETQILVRMDSEDPMQRPKAEKLRVYVSD